MYKNCEHVGTVLFFFFGFALVYFHLEFYMLVAALAIGQHRRLRFGRGLGLELVLLCRTHFIFDLCSEPFLNNK